MGKIEDLFDLFGNKSAMKEMPKKAIPRDVPDQKGST